VNEDDYTDWQARAWEMVTEMDTPRVSKETIRRILDDLQRNADEIAQTLASTPAAENHKPGCRSYMPLAGPCFCSGQVGDHLEDYDE